MVWFKLQSETDIETVSQIILLFLHPPFDLFSQMKTKGLAK